MANLNPNRRALHLHLTDAESGALDISDRRRDGRLQRISRPFEQKFYSV